MFAYWSRIRRALEYQRKVSVTPQSKAYWDDLIGAVDILIAKYWDASDLKRNTEV